VSWVAGGATRYRAFARAAESAFSGWTHSAAFGAIAHVDPSVDLEARVLGWREQTEDPSLANVTGGAELVVRVRPTPWLRTSGRLAGWYGRYDASEPDGSLRRDRHGEAELDAELDLADRWSAIGGASLEGNASTIDDFHYWRFVVRVGVVLAFGVP